MGTCQLVLPWRPFSPVKRKNTLYNRCKRSMHGVTDLITDCGVVAKGAVPVGAVGDTALFTSFTWILEMSELSLSPLPVTCKDKGLCPD